MMSEEHDEQIDGEERADPSVIGFGGEEAFEKASSSARRWEAQKRQFWVAALGSEVGRRAIWQFLVAECEFDRINVPVAVTPGNYPDPMGTMYRLGVKQVAERFFDMLQKYDHEAVYQMRLENDPAYPKPSKS